MLVRDKTQSRGFEPHLSTVSRLHSASDILPTLELPGCSASDLLPGLYLALVLITFWYTTYKQFEVRRACKLAVMCTLTSYSGLRLLGSCIFLSRLTSTPILRNLAISSSPSLFKFHGLALMENSHRNSSSFSVSACSGSGGGRGSDMRHERGRSVGGRGGNSKDKIDALGRLLTRILRHRASDLSLDMRSDGYVRVGDLLKLNLKTFANIPLRSHSVDDIREAVRNDNKQRFGLLEENGELLIRANQGHTVATIETESLLKPILSPEEAPVCVHGTYRRNLDSIMQSGLKRMKRLHVHFSSGLPTDGAVISGMRRDVNVLIFLDVRKALQDGMKLYISENKVILTEGFDGVVPVKYFERIETWPSRQTIPLNLVDGDSSSSSSSSRT